jgi:hypothetical protein
LEMDGDWILIVRGKEWAQAPGIVPRIEASWSVLISYFSTKKPNASRLEGRIAAMETVGWGQSTNFSLPAGNLKKMRVGVHFSSHGLTVVCGWLSEALTVHCLLELFQIIVFFL